MARMPYNYTTGHTSRNPPFLVGLVQKSRTKAPCINSVSIVPGGFCPGFFGGLFCLEGFVRGGFCPFPLLSEYICYNRKLNITLNFMFHMYDKIFYKCDVTCSLPPPLSQTVTPSRTPSPLERDVVYGWPLLAPAAVMPPGEFTMTDVGGRTAASTNSRTVAYTPQWSSLHTWLATCDDSRPIKLTCALCGLSPVALSPPRKRLYTAFSLCACQAVSSRVKR